MTKTFIITAGGIGKRMGTEIPKQFIEINDKPILLYTLENLHQFDQDAQLIVTLPFEWISYWNEFMERKSINIPHEVVEGGKERFYSIQNALKKATGEVIAIHDGVRPFVSHSTLNRLFEKVKDCKAVIPVLSVKESMREITENPSKHINRERYKMVQTPQCFQRELIVGAYEQPFDQHFTDDASVVESSGYFVELVDGNEENIKLTTPFDLQVAKTILSQKK